jgi:hypothetical protein
MALAESAEAAEGAAGGEQIHARLSALAGLVSLGGGRRWSGISSDDVGARRATKYFSDYIGSLDAMATGNLDANSQTLNDTMLGVATGSRAGDRGRQRQLHGQRRRSSSDESIQTVEELAVGRSRPSRAWSTTSCCCRAWPTPA